MGIITKYLGTNHDQLYANRVESLCGDLKASSEDEVRELEKKQRELLRKKESLLDLGLQNRQDLSVTTNMDAVKWAKEIHEVNYQSELVKAKLAIAKATHEELFGEDKE